MAVEKVPMTKAQERMIEAIREELLAYPHGGDPEFKSWEVKASYGGTVLVRFEVGSVGDEGTMAAVFCRNTGQVWVGKRGGLRAFRPKSLRATSIKLWEVCHLD